MRNKLLLCYVTEISGFHYHISCAVLSCSVVSDSETPWTVARQAPLCMGFSSKNTRVGYHALLQGIVPTQGSNPRLFRLLHWQAGS